MTLAEKLKQSPILYHYTTPAGFVGIVGSELKFRATHHRYLNDRTELSHGLEVIRELFSELRGEFPDDTYDRVDAEVRKLEREGVYIACFSKSPNVLSQWRGYASNGQGYCLGVRWGQMTIVEDLGEGRQWISELVDVSYSKEQARTFAGTYIREELERHKAGLPSEARKKLLVTRLAAVAYTWGASAKHEHFREEQEVRAVVSLPEDQVDYCLGRYGLTPYANVSPAELVQVWVGPNAGPSPMEALRATRAFLSKRGYAASVKLWDSPFRG